MTTLSDQYTTERRARLEAFQTHYASRKWGWGRRCAGCNKVMWRQIYYCAAPRYTPVCPRIWKCLDCYMHGGHDRHGRRHTR